MVFGQYGIRVHIQYLCYVECQASLQSKLIHYMHRLTNKWQCSHSLSDAVTVFGSPTFSLCIFHILDHASKFRLTPIIGHAITTNYLKPSWRTTIFCHILAQYLFEALHNFSKTPAWPNGVALTCALAGEQGLQPSHLPRLGQLPGPQATVKKNVHLCPCQTCQMTSRTRVLVQSFYADLAKKLESVHRIFLCFH